MITIDDGVASTGNKASAFPRDFIVEEKVKKKTYYLSYLKNGVCIIKSVLSFFLYFFL